MCRSKSHHINVTIAPVFGIHLKMAVGHQKDWKMIMVHFIVLPHVKPSPAS